MKTKLYRDFLFRVSSVLIAVFAARAQAGKTTHEPAQGNAVFAVRLYGELKDGKGNIFFSPYSISSALAMTYAGARNNTAEEMSRAMNFRLEQKTLHKSFGKLNRKLSATAVDDGHQLNIANGLCITGRDVGVDFKNLIAKHYSAELFSGGVDKINAWVSKNT